MSERFDSPIRRMVAVAIATIAALASARSVAQPAAEPAQPPMRVLFRTEAICASVEERAALADQLQSRMPDLVIAEHMSAGVREDATLLWIPSGLGDCVVVLEMAAGRESMPLGPSASEADLRAAAIRLAWWLETRGSNPAPPEPPPVPVAEQPLPEPPPPPRVPPPPPAEPSRSARFSVSAQFGVGWYPAPRRTSGVFRLFLAIPVADTVQVGLEGRLATEVEILSPGQDTDFFDRSLGVLGRYLAPIAGRWMLDVSLGLRYGFPLLEVDGEGNVDAQIERPISNLAVVAGIGGGFDLTRALRIRLDVLGAIAVANRRILGTDGQLVDLGVLTVDAVLGFELSF